jgi:hypothetical protein
MLGKILFVVAIALAAGSIPASAKPVRARRGESANVHGALRGDLREKTQALRLAGGCLPAKWGRALHRCRKKQFNDPKRLNEMRAARPKRAVLFSKTEDMTRAKPRRAKRSARSLPGLTRQSMRRFPDLRRKISIVAAHHGCADQARA